jgi:hypothetical protein
MVLIRFNHDAQNEAERWRLLINGEEFLASSVHFECKTETSKDVIICSDGTQTTKWHIRAVGYKEVVRQTNKLGENHYTIK